MKSTNQHLENCHSRLVVAISEYDGIESVMCNAGILTRIVRDTMMIQRAILTQALEELDIFRQELGQGAHQRCDTCPVQPPRILPEGYGKGDHGELG